MELALQIGLTDYLASAANIKDRQVYGRSGRTPKPANSTLGAAMPGVLAK
jgi:hypothetical protein